MLKIKQLVPFDFFITAAPSSPWKARVITPQNPPPLQDLNFKNEIAPKSKNQKKKIVLFLVFSRRPDESQNAPN